MFAGLGLGATLPAKAQTCPAPPPPVVDLDVPRFYGDEKGSVVDPAQLARHDAAVAPLTRYLTKVAGLADRAVARPSEGGRREAGSCAAAWIEGWAKGDAWLGRMAQFQAEYQRKADLAGVALAYLKVRRFVTPDQRAVIEPWLIRFADAARGFFDRPGVRRNNHWYWLGIGAAATALATGSERHWQMARGIMQDGARDIRADGTLPLELARGGRAIHYHAYSAMALVMLAELGALRGEDWYAFEDGAVHRLVDLTLRGLADPTVMGGLAGVPQQAKPGAGAGWLYLYEMRFAARLGTTWPAGRPEMKPGHRWLGGDARLIAEAYRRG